MGKLKVDEFLDLLRRSGLVERDQINRVVLQIKAQAKDKPVTGPRVVAERFVDAGLITPWQQEKLLEGRHKGFFLSSYRLLNHLGAGGMSNVFLAEHVLMQRRVAIKVLPKKRVDDSSYLARFHREAQAIANLDHRNIVRAFDFDNEGDVYFMVMEYVEGRDLQRIVKDDGRLDYRVAADYIRQAAEGLAHAHQRGLIHRDIKPANLLVDAKRIVKVLDMGLARFAGEDRASLTVAYDENVLGTADYLAPEQAIDSHGVDTRADIYSLGCAMYYLISGHPPFPDGTLPQRLMMHQKQQPRDIREERSDAPEDLLKVCSRMMAKKAEHRYQTAGEVADELGDWLTLHGHDFDSGDSSGSSRGVAAAASAAFAAVDRPGDGSAGSKTPRRPAGDTRPGSARRKGSPGGSSTQKRPTATGPSAADTDAKLKQRTSKPRGSSVKVASATAGPSSKKQSSSKLTLPTAVPLDESPLPKIVIQTEASQDQEAPVSATERIESYRRTSAQGPVPVWVWIAIGAGGLAAVALLILLLITGGGTL